MEDVELHCNNVKCRKTLTGNVWVTRCSHVFCEEELEFITKQKKCPGCNIDLPNMYDAVKNNLNPSEQFKSLVLAALKPEVVFDIAKRSVSFWNYQMTQEKVYQKIVNKQYQEHIKELNSTLQMTNVKAKNDLELVEQRLKDLRIELDNQVKKNHDLEGKIMDQNRQLNSVQSKYEALRRSAISISIPKEVKVNQECSYVEQSQFLRGYFDKTSPKAEPNNTSGFSFNPHGVDEK